jgi:NADH-quinone oxidoreductase subunit K
MLDVLLQPVGIVHYFLLSTLLFVIGAMGIFLNRRHVLSMLMALELILLAVNINFVAFSVAHGNVEGQIFSFFILTVAAAEAAIGLAILVIFFRRHHTVDVAAMDTLKG